MDVKNMNPLLVIVLFLVTFGIFPIYWFYKNKVELNSKGADIPTMWLWLLCVIPIVNIIVILFWMYKFMEGFVKVTKSDANPILYTIGMCVPLVNLYTVYLVHTAMMMA